MFVKIIVYFLCFGCMYSNCLKIIAERARLAYFNETFVEKGSILNVRKNGRGGDYVVNIRYTSKQLWGNNVSVNIYFYEYLHNEYRPTFVEMHYKLCDMILRDHFVGGIIRKSGIIACPIETGFHALYNLTFNEKIPSLWPFTKGKSDVILKAEPKGTVIAIGEVMMTFVDNAPMKRNKTSVRSVQ